MPSGVFWGTLLAMSSQLYIINLLSHSNFPEPPDILFSRIPEKFWHLPLSVRYKEVQAVGIPASKCLRTAQVSLTNYSILSQKCMLLSPLPDSILYHPPLDECSQVPPVLPQCLYIHISQVPQNLWHLVYGFLWKGNDCTSLPEISRGGGTKT